MKIDVLVIKCEECENDVQKIFTIGFRKGTFKMCLKCLTDLSNSLVSALEPITEFEAQKVDIQPIKSHKKRKPTFKVYPCRYCKECRSYSQLGMEQIEVHEVTDHPEQYRPITKPDIRKTSWRTRKSTPTS